MKNFLRLEELTQFLVCLFLLMDNNVAWWVYLLLILGPDIGMLGYFVGPRFGAVTYNLLHHKGVALVIAAFGTVMLSGSLVQFLFGAEPSMVGPYLFLAGIILYGHASMDRIFGYGLKFGDNFHHTHLGWIGKRVASDE